MKLDFVYQPARAIWDNGAKVYERLLVPEDEMVWFYWAAPGILEFGKWRECAIGFIHGFLLSLGIVRKRGLSSVMDHYNKPSLTLTVSFKIIS
jgi:hypothetical protein